MRRPLLSFALALALWALGGASSAVAQAPEGAQKAPLYGPFFALHHCESAPVATPMTFGFAILNTPGNELTLSGEVSLKRAAPKTTYEVFAAQDPPPRCVFTPVGTITTNKKGNGNLHFTTARDPFATTFFVDVVNAANEEEYASPAVELD
jgi:hypothetical protein